MLKDVTWGRPRDFLRICRSLLSCVIATLWQITACIVYNSVFWEIFRHKYVKSGYKICWRTSNGDVLEIFQGLADHYHCVILHPSDKWQHVLYVFLCFLRFGDINLQRTVSKYVLGRLMWTSSRLLKEWRILFCIRVTNNYLHCV